MNDTATPRAEAPSLLAALFYEIACEEGVDFEDFESKCISLGHSVIADAMSTAIERLDAKLCSELPEGCRVHDRREKTLASEVGDLKFRYRRVRDAFGNTVALCAEEDAALAEDMFVNGVVPGGEVESEQALVEADGTWIRLQDTGEGGPERVEIKAPVAYGSKEGAGKNTRRVDCVHHGCVASPDSFWAQGVAAIGTRFDLSKVEACKLLEAMRDNGIAREKRSTKVVGYLRNNIDLIAVGAPRSARWSRRTSTSTARGWTACRARGRARARPRWRGSSAGSTRTATSRA